MANVTPEQKREFVRNGFLVLDDIIDEERISDARRSLRSNDDVTEGHTFEFGEAEAIFREINWQLYDYADELVGGDRLLSPGDEYWGTHDDEEVQVAIRNPGEEQLTDPAAQSAMELGVHVDNQTNGDECFHTFAVGFYLDRVQPRDGGFTVWPGSHWMIAAHCELEPVNEDAEPGTGDRCRNVQIRDDSEFDTKAELFDLMCPFEIAGDAGTAILWHSSLVHASGRQLNPGSPRMAAFSRFYTKPRDWEPDAIQHPFKYWDGVDGTESTAGTR